MIRRATRRSRPRFILTSTQLATIDQVRRTLPPALHDAFTNRVSRGLQLQGTSDIADALLAKIIQKVLAELSP